MVMKGFHPRMNPLYLCKAVLTYCWSTTPMIFDVCLFSIWFGPFWSNASLIHLFQPNYHEDRLVMKGFYPRMNPLYLFKAVLTYAGVLHQWGQDGNGVFTQEWIHYTYLRLYWHIAGVLHQWIFDFYLCLVKNEPFWPNASLIRLFMPNYHEPGWAVCTRTTWIKLI